MKICCICWKICLTQVLHNPTEGQLWYDTANRTMKVYDNGVWSVLLSPVQAQQRLNLEIEKTQAV